MYSDIFVVLATIIFIIISTKPMKKVLIKIFIILIKHVLFLEYASVINYFSKTACIGNIALSKLEKGPRII